MVVPAIPQPAATMVLLRDTPGGVQVYLQRRPRRLEFAAGLWVFPGGRVDHADRDPAIDGHWSGPSPWDWARRLDVGVADARGYLVAACRETLEEAGVLLAHPAPRPRDLAGARDDLLAGRRGMAQVLADLGAGLDTARLAYRAWWVTPEGEPRRYDTRFFVATAPPDPATVAHAGEVVEERWATAPAAGTLPMLPPTRYTLRDLAAFDTTAQILRHSRDHDVPRIQPVLDGDDILLPWGDRDPRPSDTQRRKKR